MKLHRSLKSFSKIFKDLPYDTFQYLNEVEEEMLPQGETRVAINAVFSFYASIVGQNEEGGLEISTRVEMMEGNRAINALSADATMEPGKWLIYRGLPLNKGEMVLLMTLRQDKDPGDSSDSSDSESGEEEPEENEQETPPEESEQNNEEESEENSKQEEEGQQEQEGEESSEDEKEGEQSTEGEESNAQQSENKSDEGDEEARKMERPEIEALLDSLEEIDRKEQESKNKQTVRSFFPKSGNGGDAYLGFTYCLSYSCYFCQYC